MTEGGVHVEHVGRQVHSRTPHSRNWLVSSLEAIKVEMMWFIGVIKPDAENTESTRAQSLLAFDPATPSCRQQLLDQTEAPSPPSDR